MSFVFESSWKFCFSLNSNKQSAVNIFLQLKKEKLKRDKDIYSCYFLHSFYATHTTHYPLLPLQKKDSKYIYKSQDSLAASKLLTTQWNNKNWNK